MKFVNKVFAFVGCLLLGVFLSCTSSVKQQTTLIEKTGTSLNLEQIVENGQAATVQIGSLSIEGPPVTGSGFFIRQDLIVTNIHVVNQRSFEGTSSLAKLVNKPTWFTIKAVMASDPIRDLVILKVEKMGGEDPDILSLGDSDTIKTGDDIITIGNPKQGTKFKPGDVSKGTIKRITPQLFRVEAGNLRDGYSGGPIINLRGEVIGIMSLGDAIGSGYAVPSNHLQELLNDMSQQPKSLETWREEPLIRYYSAESKAHLGELTNAMKDYNTAIRLAPDFSNAYINRADTRRRLGDLDGAVDDFDMAIHLGADYAFVYANRADVKSDLGDYKGAIEDYNKAIRLKPTVVILAVIFINRGNTKSDLGDYIAAIEDYNKAIELRPEDFLLAVAYGSRAEARIELEDYIDAIEDCNTVMGLVDEDVILAEAYNVRGKAKSAQGENKNSIIDYDNAIRLEGRHPEFYYNRGIAYKALGDVSKAKTDLETALKLIEHAGNISTSPEGDTAFAFIRIKLDIRLDLKTDIETALHLLK